MTAAEDQGTTHRMRSPCRWCGETERGFLRPSNGQNVVRCAECGRACYNAPRHETGDKPRSLASRPDIKPSRRARILERDNHTCVGCHRADRPLVVAHLLSVDEGRALGATEAELFHDENLAAMCEECNAGLGHWTVSLRLVHQVLRARIAQERR